MRALPNGVGFDNRSEGWSGMKFAPVTTFDDLDGLDHDQVVEGYQSAERGDPEPGENRGRSFWHGWRCRMIDFGEIEADEGHRNLVREYLEHQRKVREAEAAALL